MGFNILSLAQLNDMGLSTCLPQEHVSTISVSYRRTKVLTVICSGPILPRALSQVPLHDYTGTNASKVTQTDELLMFREPRFIKWMFLQILKMQTCCSGYSFTKVVSQAPNVYTSMSEVRISDEFSYVA